MTLNRGMKVCAVAVVLGSDGTAFHAAVQGHVCITPLHVDLTEHAQLPHWAQRIEDLERAGA